MVEKCNSVLTASIAISGYSSFAKIQKVIVHLILVEVCGLTEVLRVHKQLLITTAEGKLRVQARVSCRVAASYVSVPRGLTTKNSVPRSKKKG
jgi:hypothetical protein